MDTIKIKKIKMLLSRLSRLPTVQGMICMQVKMSQLCHMASQQSAQAFR